ncbi:synaptotagmin-8 isoform X4 [Lutra lutra]|uniref:synaptotagmin-8 isoform X4 n=1 Tax=Lutra lutra TaxID=9657 RepID=UPI001FD5AEF6|nr:synaptotagmin-8 isoform X4 [Lutra lutra]
MGHPLGPQSSPAPAGTTAIPGLIPDLITRLPWPCWAIIAIAVAAGVLMVSCLLCAVCCCCRCGHRKKPRDREAVNLGSPQGTASTHLVQPDVDTSETAPEDAQHWGRLQLSLEYDFSRQEIPQEELAGSTLRVQVLGSKRFSAPEPLGELSLPLGAVDPQHVLEQWHQLGPPGATEPEPSGELCLSLRYIPSSGRMTVVVLEARGLSPGLADPYVKVQLMLNQRKWQKRKTSARKGTASPYFNEAFTFLVPFSQIQVGCLEEGVGGEPPLGPNRPLSFSSPMHLCGPPPRAWTWCWLSGPGAHSFGLSRWARCCLVPGPLVSPCSTGQTCWPTPGGLSPGGIPCVRPGRWTMLWA